ncbi:MAG: flagellin N-terminal helical domain-containing protein [Thermoguttaceae bacterium]
MTRINTNVSSLTAQQNLAKSNMSLQQALTRLSTGLRINSGKDDPAGLIASEALRSDIISTQTAISNTERANEMIATADSGLAQISSLLNDIRGLVTEAANDGAMSDDQIAANQLQVDASLNSIDRLANTTAFQGKKLLDGSLGFTYTTAATNISDLDLQQASLGTGGSLAVSVDITAAATQASTTGTIANGAVAASATSDFATNDVTITAAATGEAWNDITVHWVLDTDVVSGQATAYYDSGASLLTITVNNTGAVALADINAALTAAGGDFVATGGPLAAGDAMAADVLTASGTDGGLTSALNFTLTGSVGSQVFNFGVNTTGTTIQNAINANTDATGVSASYGGTTLTLTSSGYGSAATIDVKVNAGTNIFASDPVHAAGTDITGTINGVDAAGSGNTLSVNNNTLAMRVTVTNGSNTDFTLTITGGGALFQLGPEVVTTQQTRIGITAMNTGTLGGTSGKLYQLAEGQNADLKNDTATAAEIVQEANDKVTSLRGRLGAFQKTVLETNKDALGDTVNALTEAESQIRDTDFAAETANLTRAQILVQSGTAVLQIANKSPQNVLALLQG